MADLQKLAEQLNDIGGTHKAQVGAVAYELEKARRRVADLEKMLAFVEGSVQAHDVASQAVATAKRQADAEVAEAAGNITPLQPKT